MDNNQLKKDISEDINAVNNVSLHEVKNNSINDFNNSSTNDIIEKKPSRKYNGFLRNNNKGNKQIKKPTPDMHLTDTKVTDTKVTDSDSIVKELKVPNTKIKKNIPKKSNTAIQAIENKPLSIIDNKQTAEEYYVFNFLRIKSGHNEPIFWEKLQHILMTKNFSEIKKSNLSLISYSALNDSTIVFDKLLSQFGHQIQKEEFTHYIFKYAIHKNPQLIDSSLKFYEKQFTIEHNFIEQLVKDFSASSFRNETNHIFLTWTKDKMTDDLLELFWSNAILHKNVPIILQCLQHKTYLSYLQKNFTIYEKSLQSLGRLYEIKSLLHTKKNDKKVDDFKQSGIINKEIGLVNEQDFEPKIWLSDKSDQIKVIQEHLSEKKPTEVIVKRKRKIA